MVKVFDECWYASSISQMCREARYSQMSETDNRLQWYGNSENYDDDYIYFAAQDRSPLCLAVRDISGRKRCPHGTRQLSNGRREYCRKPIDCFQRRR